MLCIPRLNFAQLEWDAETTVIVTPEGKVLTDANDRLTFMNLFTKNDRIDIEPLAAEKTYRNYEYRINNIRRGQDLYKEVTIFDGNGNRDFLFVMESTSDELDASGIDKARAKWVELCNAKDSEVLVDQLYHNPTVYYNSGRAPITEKETLAKEYSYMNNPNYELNLTSILTTPVTPDIAFEIGQCSGSYQGKYIIIWKKHPEFGWQVLVDSNI